jgi:hypothetical protein
MSPPAPILGARHSPTTDLPFSWPGATTIVVLLSVLLLCYSLALLLCRLETPRPAPKTPFSTPKQHHARTSRPLGLEDDPTRWPPPNVRGDWTELDERQLIRLLTDSASTTPPATDPP